MSSSGIVLIAALAAGTSVLVVIEGRAGGRFPPLSRWALYALALSSLAVVGALCVDHAGFPLNLKVLDGTVLQHVRRAAAGQPIYVEPEPDYVALSYNPLYYYACVPFTWIFGPTLLALRLVSVLSMAGIAVALFLVVRARTGAAGWGLTAAGLFAAAYRVMDAHLDSAHPDALMVFLALAGCAWLERKRSAGGALAGTIVLVAAFWAKQHGALFVAGGLLFVTLRDGLRRSWACWAAALALGPAAYAALGPRLFGREFFFFTWEMPRRWTEWHVATFVRCARFVARVYPVLAAGAALQFAEPWRKTPRQPDIWAVQLPFACLTGLLGALDPGSSDNVFIPMGVFLILSGTLGLHGLAERLAEHHRFRADIPALAVSFGLLAYSPVGLWTAPEARRDYDAFVEYLRSLEGQVYAPSLGQLESGFTLRPAAHWVVLEDLIRGPGRDTRNHPLTRRLLAPALHPEGPAYVLANSPLETYPWIAFLEESYVLQEDLGDRFRSLGTLPGRWDCGWPRYLFRYVPRRGEPHGGAP